MSVIQSEFLMNEMVFNFMKTVKVKAPATIANLVCGFDVLGLCTEVPYDVMEVQLRDDRVVSIKSADGYPLPTDPALNTAGAPPVRNDQSDGSGYRL